jgi:hypothetical protein
MRAAGQQGSDLVGAAHVIQDDQHLPVREQATVQGGGFVHVLWDLVSWYPECAQEPAEHLHGLDRLLDGVTTHVHV